MPASLSNVLGGRPFHMTAVCLLFSATGVYAALGPPLALKSKVGRFLGHKPY